MPDIKIIQKTVSIVVPLYNEEKNIQTLYLELKEAVEHQPYNFELLFIDDGSSDSTPDILRNLQKEDARVRILRLRKRFGQAAALQAGFDLSSGDIIIAMDGDLQHAPSDIPQFLKTIEQGYDIVSGFRPRRAESYFFRILPSKIANQLIRLISHVPIRDFGTTFKAYRRVILKDLQLQGELHRFIPAILGETGCKITEIPIHCRQRVFGKSNYNLSRILTVLMDVIVVKFLASYLTRPSHIFGLIGLMGILPGISIILYTIFTFFMGIMPPVHHGVLLLFATLVILLGFQFLTFGLLAEISSRIYLKIHNKRPYYLAEQDAPDLSSFQQKAHFDP